jgi:hypothetical protein
MMSLKKITLILLLLSFGLFAQGAFAQQNAPIGSGVLHVLGIDLAADPAQQSVPINTGTGVNTDVVYPNVDFGGAVPGLPEDFTVVPSGRGPAKPRRD